MARPKVKNKPHWKPVKARLRELAEDRKVLDERKAKHKAEVIEVVLEAKELGIPVTHITEEYDCKPMTIYRMLEEVK